MSHSPPLPPRKPKPARTGAISTATRRASARTPASTLTPSRNPTAPVRIRLQPPPCATRMRCPSCTPQPRPAVPLAREGEGPRHRRCAASTRWRRRLRGPHRPPPGPPTHGLTAPVLVCPELPRLHARAEPSRRGSSHTMLHASSRAPRSAPPERPRQRPLQRRPSRARPRPLALTRAACRLCSAPALARLRREQPAPAPQPPAALAQRLLPRVAPPAPCAYATSSRGSSHSRPPLAPARARRQILRRHAASRMRAPAPLAQGRSAPGRRRRRLEPRRGREAGGGPPDRGAAREERGHRVEEEQREGKNRVEGEMDFSQGLVRKFRKYRDLSVKSNFSLI
jgi:hypothetical protein